METITKILKSKTVIVAVLQAVSGIVVAISTTLPELGWTLVAKSALDIALRLITVKPLL